MKLNFELTSVIGANYQNGHVSFTPDNRSLLSPVGNNVSILHLTTDEIKTFEVNSSHNIVHIILSPTSLIMICINEKGYANIVSMITGEVINFHNFRGEVSCAKFSPDGRYLAIGRGKLILVYNSPSLDSPLSQLKLKRTFDGASGTVTSLDWTCDSKAFVAGSSDCSTRVYANFATDKLVLYSMGGNIGEIVKSGFMRDSLDVLSVSKNGRVCHWVCNKSLKYLSDNTNGTEPPECEETTKKKHKHEVSYLKAKHYFYRCIDSDKPLDVDVSVADFNRHLNLLVTGFVNGKIMIHDMPDFIPRQYFDISTGVISTISFDNSGSLIAIGCSELNQLDVWNWRSQTVYFRSKGHARSAINCLDYSPDGSTLVTGGHDGLVKVWQIATGRCSTTFSDHTGPVTGVCFPAKKTQTLFSSSLDGTLRGYDLGRKKNFCALTPGERAYQLSCVSADDMGQIVAAGGASDCFAILVWEVRTRQLIYTLSGHEQPVSSIQFASLMSSGHLVSGSWDKSMRIWQLLDGQSKEVFNTNSDVLTVAYRPDGKQIAGALLNGSIVFFDTNTNEQVKEIEAKYDLGISKKEGELVTARKASEEKIIKCLCYSANGELILAGGNTKYICLYSVADQLLLRRYQITCNLSIEGVLEVHDRRRITQWGFSDSQIAISTTKTMPGAKQDNNTLRQVTVEAAVSCLKFSPTGTHFCASSTEGVLVFSTERVFRTLEYLGGDVDFSQFRLDVTPASVRQKMRIKNYCSAINDALRIKRMDLLLEVIETVPIGEVGFIVSQLRRDEVGHTLVRLVARQLRVSTNKGFYGEWAKCALMAWAEQCWSEQSLEWTSGLVELVNSVEHCKQRMVGADLATHKTDWINAMLKKNNKC